MAEEELEGALEKPENLISRGVISVNDSVTYLEEKFVKDRVYAFDNGYNYTVMVKNVDGNMDFLYTKNLGANAGEKPHKYMKPFSIGKIKADNSKGYKLVANVPVTGSTQSFIYNIDSDKEELLATNDWHTADIETSTFSNTGKYLVTGGQDGKVFFFDPKNDFQVCHSLRTRGDYISNIVFNSKDTVMVVSGYDKKTVVINLERQKLLTVITTTDVVESIDFFDKDRKLYMVTRDGHSLIYDLVKFSMISTVAPFHSWPSCFDITKDEKFAVVGTRSNELYIIKLEDNLRVAKIPTQYPAISGVKVIDDRKVAISTVTGSIEFYDYKEYEKEFEEALNNKDYKQARELINKNIFLTINEKMKLFDEAWPSVLNEAIEFLNKDDIDSAVNVVDPFTVDSEKRKEEFEFYLGQREGIAAFKAAVEAKDIKKAYALLSRYTFLTKTTFYTTLEQIAEAYFRKALTLLEQDPNMNKKPVSEMLQPFVKSDKREIVQAILNNPGLIANAIEAAKNSKFKEYYAIVAKLPPIKLFKIHEKVEIIGGKMMEKAKEFEESGKYEAALEMLKAVDDFPAYKMPAARYKSFIDAKIEMLKYIEMMDYERIFETLAKNESLRSMPDMEPIIADFELKYDEALKQSYTGDAKSTMKAFKFYLNIPYWQDKIAIAMRNAYIKEIENTIDSPDVDTVNWSITIKRFYDRFGSSDELFKIFEEHEMDDVMKEFENKEGNNLGYRTMKYSGEIVIYKTSPDAVEEHNKTNKEAAPPKEEPKKEEGEVKEGN